MFGIPETVLYLAIAIAAALVALMGPLHSVVYLDLAVVGAGDLSVAGVRIDASDIVFAMLVLGLLLRAPRTVFSRRVPYLYLWLGLGTFLTAAYLVAPVNQHQLVEPLSIAYQIYRYCWQPILPYLLGVLLFSREDRSRQLLQVLTLIGGVLGLGGMLQGFQGLGSTSAFSNKNAFGGWLIVVLPCAIALLTLTSRRRLLVIGALSLMLGSMVYAGSRGALVAFVVAAVFMSVLLFSRSAGRRRLAQLALTAASLLLIAAVLKPGLLNRPNVQPFLALTEGADEVSTFTWRQEHRWPHFFALAREHPWFGIGTFVDTSLGGRAANTPHNGYLAISVRSGFPAAILYLIFGLLAVRNGALLFRRHPDRDVGMIALGLATAVLAVLVHNYVESTLVTQKEIGRMFFLATGVLAGLHAAWSEERVAAKRAAKAEAEATDFATVARLPQAEPHP
ncbi:MAG TPA: O-antigen ligase family protein [Thermoanaerobaculia bacterium]|nr:O-antigen ligase family protein [Thermoanaerobaculia bacterium]